MRDFKQQCIALRKKDFSIIEIMRITGRPKSSIYTHIHTIPLSAKKQAQVKKASGEHIRQFAIRRKGKSLRPFKPFKAWTPELVLLLGHLLFDGEIQRNACVYNNRSVALITRVESLMREIYDWPPKKIQIVSTGVLRVAYYNVALAHYLHQKSDELLAHIHTLSREYKREFLRAFFDDEGCMNFRNKTRRIRGYQKDVAILKLIQKLLSEFDILSHIEKPNEVVISGKENLIMFQKEIDFSRGVRINGKRSNSIWKQSLEKREILRRAITSFKS